MATNPMKRQARTSFLLGVVVTLLIAAIIVALLFIQLKKINEKNQEFEKAMAQVYVLTSDVNSGDVLTSDMFTVSSAMRSAIPADYIDITSLLNSYSLYTKDGQPITSKYETDANTKATEQHLYINGDESQEIVREDSTGRYYKKSSRSEKEYVDTIEAPVIAKIDAKKNTVISPSLIARSNELDTDDVRKQEYNMLVLPTDLMDGDVVDIRLALPSGQDYIVVSKKRVTVPNVSGEYLADTIQVKMSEGETLTMSNAMVEAYRIEGSKLYVAKYTEAGIQESATPTYVVSEETARLIQSDPNIVTEARNALIARYNSNAGLVRNQVNSAISNNGKDENVQTKMEESITSTKETRQRYLQSLSVPQSN